MIEVRCSECGYEMKAGEEHAGQTGKCPKCGGAVHVPTHGTPVQATPPAAATSPPAKKQPGNFQDALKWANKYPACAGCLGCIGLMTAFMVFVFFAIAFGSNPPPSSQSTYRPSTPQQPAVQLTPEQQLRKDLEDAIGKVNRDNVETISRFDLLTSPSGGQILHVGWAISDNLTENMIKQGAKLDLSKMLQVVQDCPLNIESVTFYGSYAMVDRYGESSEDNVVKATYSKETINRLNFSGFLHDNVYSIADDVYLHRVFRD